MSPLIGLSKGHYIGRETYGFAVTKIIASLTKGSHHQISRLSDGEELVEDIFEGISEEIEAEIT